jgi:exodeoxyribonuclease-3
MKIITYNVNGIRSALSKNWLEWLKAANPDVVCLQEIKATPDQLTDLLLLEQMGYEHYWNPAEKKGYSGTAIFTKISPKHVEYSSGMDDYDREGRILRADFEGDFCDEHLFSFWLERRRTSGFQIPFSGRFQGLFR